MIKSIVFDMGNVLLRFEPELFIERLGVAPEDRRMLLVQVFRSLEWAKMDRGSLTERQAAELICRRVPERLHSAVHSLTDQWERPILPVEGSYELVQELKEKGYRSQLRSITMLKNKANTLPLRKGIKLYVTDRFIKSYLDFMSNPTPAAASSAVLPMWWRSP